MPWGVSKGLKPTKKKIIQNVLLEETYLKNAGSLSHHQVIGLAKQLDWNIKQVQRWSDFTLQIYRICFHVLNDKILHLTRIRYRKQQNKPSALVKLTESGWRFTYYSFAVCYGIWALWDKPWFWNIDECWTDYPHQVM